MNTTESNRICVCCDAPFLPASGDLCERCEQRRTDRLGGMKLSAWIAAALVFSLMAAYSKCHGDERVHEVYPGRIYSDFQHGWKKQQFPVKPTEGKAGQYGRLNHTNQTKQLTVYGSIIGGAPAIHSAGASVVDDMLLNKVAWTESRNNPRAVGKLGEIGMFQLRPIAIREVNRVYGTKYHIRDATKMVESREIARLYLLICESRCRVKTPANVYAKYRGVK